MTQYFYYRIELRLDDYRAKKDEIRLSEVVNLDHLTYFTKISIISLVIDSFS